VSKQKRLGRGLEALLGRVAQRTETPPPADGPYGGAIEEPYQPPPEQPTRRETEVAPEVAAAPEVGSPEAVVPEPAEPSGTCRIDVRQIDGNPSQPRQEFHPGEMQALAESISAHGLLQPVVVRRVGNRYQLIAGERRLRAAIEAGWTDVPVNVVEADDRQAAELAIVENLQRKDLSPLEKAASFQRYLEQYGGTQEELAARLKLDRSTIANLIRLLELPEPVREALRRRKITQGHARALLPLGEEREQVEFCRRIQQEGLNVRQTEKLVQESIEAADGPPLGVVGADGRTSRTRRPRSDHLAALEQELRAALGLKVKITHNARGRGKIAIHFRNHEEFERLRRQITESGQPRAQSHAG